MEAPTHSGAGRIVGEQETEHLRWLRQEIGDDLLDAAVIFTGRYTYRRPGHASRREDALMVPVWCPWRFPRTASMIVGRWCPVYGPFDPRS